MQRRTRTTLAIATAVALTAPLLALGGPATAAPAPAPKPKADFNGDGYGDIAVPAPFSAVGAASGAGRVVVLYGSATGVSPAHRQVLTQGTAGIPGTPEQGAGFGRSSAVGDFNADGFTDLAVAAPYAGGLTGSLSVVFGSPDGLSGAVTLDDPEPVPGPASPNSRKWGAKLTAGDFDGDGRDELIAGALPTRSPGTTLHAFKGIDRTAPAPTAARITVPFTLSRLVNSLTAGDVTGDGRDDLLVESLTSANVPSAHVVPGSPTGLAVAAATPVPAGTKAVGDLNGDGYADIVTGQPSDTAAQTGGRVLVSYGSATGPAPTPVVLTQESTGIPGSSEKNDYFGNELSFGDVNGDGYQDLAVGSLGQTVAGAAFAGRVVVVYGSAQGPATTGTQSFSRATKNIPGDPRLQEQFGAGVELADTDGDGKADLFAGAASWPYPRGSSVTVLPSTGKRIGTARARSINPQDVGLPADDTSFGDTFAR
ncbi:FG-GAP-like repeat-containing protein [Streptomyces sp. NRRL S-87]|uniref:FG-GAP-like repeat-containing protein n=1 Tax=Streptomyces sp. NRRL S-87 TaxID=1463920 RepID=UPI0004C10E1C|nr:FG-GAP-like repeat-containing protein [Streptomyces sp. NRRL S-87]